MTNPFSLEIIKSKSIKEELNSFHNSFNSIYINLSLSNSLDAVHKIDNKDNIYQSIKELLLIYIGLQNLALDFILAL
jgi:hypothetical protein